MCLYTLQKPINGNLFLLTKIFCDRKDYKVLCELQRTHFFFFQYFRNFTMITLNFKCPTRQLEC